MTETALAQSLLSVPDVSCDHCARTITNALAPLPGIASVSVDVPSKTVRVSYDASRLNIARIAEVLAGEDYPVAKAD